VKYKFKDNIVFREESDTYALLYNVDSADIQILDPIGTYISRFLEEWVDVEEIVTKALLEFDGEELEVRRDIQEFVKRLQDDTLVEGCSGE